MSATYLTPAQVAEIAKRWSTTTVLVSQADTPRCIPADSVWVRAENEFAGIVLLPDGSEDAS